MSISVANNKAWRIDKLYTKAYYLALFVVVYNFCEALIAIFYGAKDHNLTLTGFGFDSLVEVASNLGIIYMIRRIKRNPNTPVSTFETKALRITGTGFYVLSVSLLVGAAWQLVTKQVPEVSLSGVIISIISIGVMLFVVINQLHIGKEIPSEPIIADAKCTLTCIYMSVVLLISSAVYYFTGFIYADVIGAVGLIYFSIKEGRECFEEAKGKACHCH